MCTFADGGEPVCLKNLSKHLHWQRHFKFNNSALYVDPSKGGDWGKFFWNLGADSVEKFLDFVVENSRTPMSLTLAREVLQIRQRMQDQADGAMERIARGLEQAEFLHAMLKDMKSHRKDLDANKDYTFKKKVNVQKQVELGPGENAYQFCTDCNQLCCQYCVWEKGIPQSPCTYFHGGAGCPRCRQCPRERHVRQRYREITEEVEQVATLDGKKNAHEAAQRGISAAQNALRNQAADMEALAKDLLEDMQALKDSRARLDEIAMKKVNHSNVGLFGQMIQEEEKAAAPGWKLRVKSLQQAKERAEAIEKLVDARSMVDLFPAYQDAIQEVLNDQEVLDESPRGGGRGGPGCCLM
jgi:hypothetical protein